MTFSAADEGRAIAEMRNARAPTVDNLQRGSLLPFVDALTIL